MQLHTFRARSIQEALRLVRAELGPDASVLETREVGSRLARWMGGQMIEVTASTEIAAPSRFAEESIPAAELYDYRRQFREDLEARAEDEPSLVEQLASPSASRVNPCQPASFAHLRRQMMSIGVSAATADRWLERLQAELACDPDRHPSQAADRLRQIVQSDLPVRGPIRLSAGRPTVVALVGPTGVGKTTTLAKLAAHYRLRERRNVALVTVDTYRIAAVEQLRTYAEIMDLPMEVVATPCDMRAALKRLRQHDLVLIDTAGSSPRDQKRLAELQACLDAAQPDEVALVFGCVAGTETLRVAARAFAAAGASSLILTKLDEAWQIGQLPDWLAASRLPLCYTTHGQNVPDDIQPASASHLANLLVPITAVHQNTLSAASDL